MFKIKTIIQILFLMLCIVLFIYTGCKDDDGCSRGGKPFYPHGEPDSIDYDYGRDGWQSLSYAYFNHYGQYINYVYVSEDECTKWYLQSTFKGDAIK